MNKNNLVFGLCGVIIGIILGVFLAAQSVQRVQSVAPMNQQITAQSSEQEMTEGQPQINEAMLSQIAEQEQILRRDPENQSAIISLANLHFDVNNHSQATQWYEKALQKDPNNINLITDLGTSYLQLQNVEKSLEMYKKALSIDPKHHQTLMNLGIARMTAGDNAGAAEAWEKLIVYYPEDPNVEKLKDAVQKMKTRD